MLDGPDLPRTGRELGLERSIRVILIEMLPTVTLAEPEERVVAEPVNRSRTLDPGLGRITEQPFDRALFGAGSEFDQVEPGLDTILNVAISRRTVGPPADLADQKWIG